MSSDRPGRLRLDLIDVYGDRLNERVDIFLRHNTLSETLAARDADARKRIVIPDLLANPQGLYRLLIDPPSYLPVAAFVNIDASKFTDKAYVFAIDNEKVIRVNFPAWADIDYSHTLLTASRNVLGSEGTSGEPLYTGLDDIRRCGLLNILAKCRRTAVAGGAIVLDSILELRELRGDRFFAVVPHQLREDVKNSVASGLFMEVDGSLHHPPPGFSPAGSFKTPDRYGNLQLTFFASSDTWMADVDIDDANGLEHVFQVARNAVTGRPTHPYDIQQILIRYQEIDPGYRLIVREQPMAQAAGESA